MPNSTKLASSRCPQCGAPIDLRSITPEQLQVECAYCGTPILLPGNRQAQRPRPPQTVIVARSDGKSMRASSCGVWLAVIITFIVLASAVIPQIIINRSTTEAVATVQRLQLPVLSELVPQPIIYGVVAPFPPGDGPETRAVTVAALTRNDSEETLVLGIDLENGIERWRSVPFSKDFTNIAMVGGQRFLYVVDGARMSALHRTNGEIAWQVSLANALQTPCEPTCVALIGTRLLTLARDGTLQSFYADSGATAWSRRLNSQPRTLLPVHDQVAIVDTDSESNAVFYLFDAANGDVLHEIAPSCQMPFYLERPHPSDLFLLSQDGSSLFVLDSGNDTCAWRYDLTSGALQWQYHPAQGEGVLPFSWTFASVHLGEQFLYFSDETLDPPALIAIDVQDGTPHRFYEENGYSMRLVEEIDGLLLVAAAPDYDRDAQELWAIDLESGTRRWQFRFQTTHTFDKWYLRHNGNPGELFVAQCLWEAEKCVFEILTLQTGTSGGQTTVDVRGTPAGVAWTDRQMLLTLNGDLYAINLADATIARSWP